MGRPWTRAELLLALEGVSSWSDVLTRMKLPLDPNVRFRVRRRLTQLGIEHLHLAPLPRNRPGRKRTWTDDDLRLAVATSRSVSQAIRRLGLIPAGGNYAHIQRCITRLELDTSHLTGKGWNVGMAFRPRTIPLDEILVKGRWAGSHTLKLRLFREGLKQPRCELCGWAESAAGGRIPVELDHINGDRNDNRLENLRILCPNCHSLQPTHRGLNQRRRKK
jgi:hypothetical protein